MNWLWTAWIVLVIASFAVFEGWAIASNKTTLSEYVRNGARAWPLLPFVFGLVFGGLAVHFFWPGGCD